jgi:hypothetical protein
MQIVYPPVTDYYTKTEVDYKDSSLLSQITTASGDVVGWVSSQHYITPSVLTTTSGDIVSQIPTDYITLQKLTTTSGDIVSRIPIDYITLQKLITASGDIVSQIVQAEASGSILSGNDVFTGHIGTSLLHNLGVLDHTIFVTPASSGTYNSDTIATIGNVYVQIGLEYDTVYNTGGPTSSGIPFVWGITVSGGGGGSGSGTGTFSNTINLTGGESLVKYNVVYQNLGDGLLFKASCNGLYYQADALGMVTSTATISGQSVEVTVGGPVTNPAWNWTKGADLYVDVVSGTLVEYPPTISGYFAKPMAQAIESQTIWVDPQDGWEVGTIAGAITTIYVPVPGPTGSGVQGEPGIQGEPGPIVGRYSIMDMVGEDLLEFDIVYQDYSDLGKYKKAINTSLAETDACGIVVNGGGILADHIGEIVLWGAVDNPSWSLTSGKPIFLADSYGNFSHDPPTTSGHWAKPLGRATTTTGIWFQPELGWEIEDYTTISGVVTWEVSKYYIDTQDDAVKSWVDTNFVDNSELLTASGNIIDAVTVTGTGGVQTYRDGDAWVVDGTEVNTSMVGTNGIEVSYANHTWYVDGGGVVGGGGGITTLPSGLTLSGTVLQVQQAVKTDTWSSTTTSFTDVPGLSVTLNPTSSGSQFLVTYHMHISANAVNVVSHQRVLRNSQIIAVGDTSGSKSRVSTGGSRGLYDVNGGVTVSMTFLDSPPTSTSGITYKMQLFAEGATSYVNRPGGTLDTALGYVAISTITVSEIGTLVIPAIATPVYYGGSFDNAVVGNGVFSVSGTVINHRLNNPDHFLSVIPVTSNNDIAALIGTIYTSLGTNYDTVYTTGGSDANGINFQWMATASGGNRNVMTGTASGIPASGIANRLYIPTDNYYASIDAGDGTGWSPIPVLGIKGRRLYSSSFTPVAFGSIATLTDEPDGGLILKHVGNGTSRLSTPAVQAIPASGPYNVIAGFNLCPCPYTKYTWGGICLTDGTSNPKIIEFSIVYRAEDGGNTIEFQYENSPTSWNSEPWRPAAPMGIFGNYVFFKIYDDRSSTITLYVSPDGRNWVYAYSTSRTAFLTPSHAGFFFGQALGSSLSSSYPVGFIKLFYWYLGA